MNTNHKFNTNNFDLFAMIAAILRVTDDNKNIENIKVKGVLSCVLAIIADAVMAHKTPIASNQNRIGDVLNSSTNSAFMLL